jgi:hypothetical protein
MRGEVERVNGAFVAIPHGVSDFAARGIVNRHRDRQEAQRELQSAMMNWAGGPKYVEQLTDSEIYRKFWYLFGVDVLTAQTLGAREAAELTERIKQCG